jgi:glutamyl-tRNA reductase
MQVVLFGLNHKAAAIDQLECFALKNEEVMASLQTLHSHPQIDEIAILTTCNRTEFYAVCAENVDLRPVFRAHLRALKGESPGAAWEHFYFKVGEAAKRHLFTVACGLDSVVVGENEIAGQVKGAYGTACRAGTAGTLLHKLFHAAFRASKRAKNETEINKGCCSTAAAAVDLAEAFCGDLKGASVLVIGVGEIGSIGARILANRQTGEIVIANRTLEKAAALAAEVGGRAVSVYGLRDELARADAVISATDSNHCLFEAGDMAAILKNREKGPLLIVDLAVPRDFDPGVGALPEVVLKNVFDLKEVVTCNLVKREQSVDTVERIIAEELQKFIDWRESLRINPVIQAVKTQVETIRREELARMRDRFDESAYFQVERLTRSLAKKYLQAIVLQLKHLQGENCLDAQNISLIEELFTYRGKAVGD